MKGHPGHTSTDTRIATAQSQAYSAQLSCNNHRPDMHIQEQVCKTDKWQADCGWKQKNHNVVVRTYNCLLLTLKLW